MLKYGFYFCNHVKSLVTHLIIEIAIIIYYVKKPLLILSLILVKFKLLLKRKFPSAQHANAQWMTLYNYCKLQGQWSWPALWRQPYFPFVFASYSASHDWNLNSCIMKYISMFVPLAEHSTAHLWGQGSGARRGWSRKRTSAPQMSNPHGSTPRVALVLRSRRSWPVAPQSYRR